MPPRSFVSSVYCASPGERRSRSFESTPCRKACAPAPATRAAPCARRRRRRRAVRTARCSSSITPAYCTGISQPAKGTRRPPESDVAPRTAACAAARPALRAARTIAQPRSTPATLRRPCTRASTSCASALAARASSSLIAPIEQRKRELVAQVRAHHLGAVRRDGHAHPGVEERAEDVAHLVGVGERAGQQVGGRADLEHDARAPRAARSARDRRRRGCRGRCGRAAATRRPRRPRRRSPPRRSAPSRRGRPRAPAARAAARRA